MHRDMLTHLLQTVLEMAARHDGTFTDSMARQVESDFRQLYGGDEIYIQKDNIKKQRALEEAKKTGRPLEAANNNGISRSAMYRLLNKKSDEH